MRVTLALKESIFDCAVKITDSFGTRSYYIYALCDENCEYPTISVEFFDSDFTISLTPIAPNMSSAVGEIETEECSLKERFTAKTAKFLINSLEKVLDKMILRVGCEYHITSLQDGDRLDIGMQNIILESFDRYNLLELTPVIYSFFELSNFNKFYKLKSSCEVNRKDIIKFTKIFCLTDIPRNGIGAFITYPLQIFRIKHLTNKRKISRKLNKFNVLSKEGREKFLKKQEKLFDKY